MRLQFVEYDLSNKRLVASATFRTDFDLQFAGQTVHCKQAVSRTKLLRHHENESRSSLSRLVGKELRLLVQWLLLAIFACAGGTASAQEPTAASQLPTPAASSSPVSTQPKNDRIFGVVPNYRTVENPQAKIEPITVKQKFKLAADDSFDPYAYVVAGVFAGIAQTQNDPPSWGEESWGPFAKRYAASFADQTIENFMTEAIVPLLLKQDPRYFRLGPAASSSEAAMP